MSNVGDVAGMGADLYESYVGSILATFSLGACAGYGWAGMILPILLAVCGILCSIVGTFFVKTEENASQKSLLRSLRTGTYLAAVLSALAAAPLTYFMVGNWGSTPPSCAASSAAAPSATLRNTTPRTPISPPRSWPPPRRRALPPSSSGGCPWACCPPSPPFSS